MKLAIIVAHAGAGCIGEALLSWGHYVPIYVVGGHDGILPAYQRGFESAKKDGYDLLAYFHDDLIIGERDWDVKVWNEFLDPKVGLVGFGGATGHGSPDLYKAPYHYSQLGRSNFLSNMNEAEVHGKRFTGSCDVAVLDGFSMIVRTELLEQAGGWPVGKLDYIAYDYALCCLAHRFGYKIRLVGVECDHLGGRTYVQKGIGKRPEAQQEFLDAHEWIYKEFSDVLPWRCE